MRRFITIAFYHLFSLIELLLILRFALRLLSANPGALVVSYLYRITNYLLSPITGIFPDVALPSGGVLDTVAFSAMVLYLIAFLILFKILNGLFRSREFI